MGLFVTLRVFGRHSWIVLNSSGEFGRYSSIFPYFSHVSDDIHILLDILRMCSEDISELFGTLWVGLKDIRGFFRILLVSSEDIRGFFGIPPV